MEAAAGVEGYFDDSRILEQRSSAHERRSGRNGGLVNKAEPEWPMCWPESPPRRRRVGVHSLHHSFQAHDLIIFVGLDRFL